MMKVLHQDISIVRKQQSQKEIRGWLSLMINNTAMMVERSRLRIHTRETKVYLKIVTQQSNQLS